MTLEVRESDPGGQIKRVNLGSKRSVALSPSPLSISLSHTLTHTHTHTQTDLTAASGTGGLAEFCATLKDDAIHYGAFVIYGVDVRGNVTSRREKFVQVTWVGANVKVMAKSKVSGQRSAAMAYFRGYHIAYQIMDGDRDDISEAELGKKLLQVGGAHKPKYYDFGGDSGAAAKEKTRSGTMHGGEVAPGDMKEDDGAVEAAGREDAGGGKVEDGGDTTIAVDVVADVATSPRPRTKSKPVPSVPGTPPPQPPPAAVAKRRASEDAERKEEAATHEAEAAAEELRTASVAAAAAKAAEADAAANAAAADAEMKAERDAAVRVEAERAEQAERARNDEEAVAHTAALMVNEQLESQQRDAAAAATQAAEAAAEAEAAAKSAATVAEQILVDEKTERATYTGRALAAVEGADDTAALEAAMAGWLCVVKSNRNHR